MLQYIYMQAFLEEVVWDSLLDSLIVFPFLFIIYILMEVIENAQNKEKIEKLLSGRFAPVYSALTGIVPQCGFSVCCAKLYDGGFISLGALLAAFISTSDEGLIVLISNGTNLLEILYIVLFKIFYAILIGELVAIFLKKLNREHVCPEDGDCIECGKHQEKKIDKYFLHPLYHTLKTFAFILCVNFVFATLKFIIGEEVIVNFIKQNEYLEPIVCSVLGIIPNCASSIIISQSYASGIISFGGLMAGLCANAGMGLIVIFRNKKEIKKNLLIVGLLLAFGIIAGYINILFKIFI